MFEMKPSKYWWHEADTLLLRTADVQRHFVDLLDSDPYDHFISNTTKALKEIKELTEDMGMRFQEALDHDLERHLVGIITLGEYAETANWFTDGIEMVDGVMISWRMLATINETRQRRQLRVQLRKMWKALGTLRAHIKARYDTDTRYEDRTPTDLISPYLSSAR